MEGKRSPLFWKRKRSAQEEMCGSESRLLLQMEQCDSATRGALGGSFMGCSHSREDQLFICCTVGASVSEQ